MLKKGVKTINAEFIRTNTLFQLSFVQFRPCETSFPGLLLSLMLMPKVKKILGMSLDLLPLFQTSLDAKVKDLVLNVDYLENRYRNFIQKKYGRNRCLSPTHVFLHGLFTLFMTPKSKK